MDFECIVNPRRGPRATARCHAHLALAGNAFEAETEDIGPLGCQVVATRPFRLGQAVEVLVASDAIRDRLQAAGRVAWASSRAPWRIGIAFEAPAIASATRWFDQLVEAIPGIAASRGLPDRIPGEATLYLATPPRFVVDFSADEVAVLRQIASGLRVDELQARLRDRWPGAIRAVFSLLARKHVTLSRSGAVAPDAWRTVLAGAEATLAIESLGRALPWTRAPRAAPVTAETRVPAPTPGATSGPTPADRSSTIRGWSSALVVRGGAPAAALPASPAPRSATRRLDAGAEGGRARPLAGHDGAGVGWRSARPRSPEAQGCYERAIGERNSGRIQAAMTLLRRALALAPGDPEIARALGELAFRAR
jgi:hypothetical protein